MKITPSHLGKMHCELTYPIILRNIDVCVQIMFGNVLLLRNKFLNYAKMFSRNKGRTKWQGEFEKRNFRQLRMLCEAIRKA